ncbi:SDR family oxidoreductase [Saccharospirillum sp. HFRX-1]|uniref:SDR family oxidoreductase n=1 Tax=unclassified Saccharospirillum TaxID=2633430 RepID=UPI003720D94F
MAHWTQDNIPNLAGRLAVITGTGGIGFETALAMARAGASVVIAGRDPAKGAAAVKTIKQAVPSARLDFGQLDLANLASIKAFATELAQHQQRLDILINNAGIMNPPKRRETADGFELQLGTNYLGHFALTAHLLPLLKAGDRPRVVSLSSVAARSGAIDLSDLQAQRRYVPMVSYSQSKLACLMFALELNRRSEAAGWGISSLAAHPGVSRTDLLPNGSGASSVQARIRRYLPFLFQPAWQGALPSLYAATEPTAKGGHYYGPDRLGGTRGYPKEDTLPKQALDQAVSAQLWAQSEALTGVHFD